MMMMKGFYTLAILFMAFCRKMDPETMKMTASGKLNPPDLWIHHDQMELKQMQQHQTLLSSSSNEFDLIDDHRTTHSLDKRALRASARRSM